jgi:hypothetical protein
LVKKSPAELRGFLFPAKRFEVRAPYWHFDLNVNVMNDVPEVSQLPEKAFLGNCLIWQLKNRPYQPIGNNAKMLNSGL